MLDVWGTSGNKVISIPVEGLADVRELKKRLKEVCGVTRFRQRLLHEQNALEDEFNLDTLDPPFDLQLVVLPFCAVSDDEAIELRKAACHGNLGRVEEILQRPHHPDSFTANGDFMADLSRFRDRRVHDLAKQTPLFWAIDRNNREIACRLLEAEADVHKSCKDPVSLLLRECDNGEVETLNLITAPRAGWQNHYW
ncbi:mask [Symbiodinium sp. CCMP2592]|nr:mask [Symbiodinium sp. CCMP2592]